MSEGRLMGPVQDLHFNRPDAVGGWHAIDDRVMGGVSLSRLTFHPDGYAVFEGMVSTANGGGFASVRNDQLRLGEPGIEGYGLRVRGDGKRYKFNLRLDGDWDGVNYQAAFQPEAGCWSDVELPLNRFSPRFRGRPVTAAEPLRPEWVRQVGLMVADGQSGPFRLEIQRITLLKPSPNAKGGSRAEA